MSSNSHSRSTGVRTMMIVLPIILVVFDVIVILSYVRVAYFISTPIWQYLSNIWAATTAIVAGLAALATAARVIRSAVSGRRSQKSFR